MDEIVDFIIIPILVTCTCLFGLLIFDAFNNFESKNDYSYIDIDGRTGSADYCGRDTGQLYCRAGDRTIHVKEYTKIKEEE